MPNCCIVLIPSLDYWHVSISATLVIHKYLHEISVERDAAAGHRVHEAAVNRKPELNRGGRHRPGTQQRNRGVDDINGYSIVPRITARDSCGWGTTRSTCRQPVKVSTKVQCTKTTGKGQRHHRRAGRAEDQGTFPGITKAIIAFLFEMPEQDKTSLFNCTRLDFCRCTASTGSPNHFNECVECIAPV